MSVLDVMYSLSKNKHRWPYTKKKRQQNKGSDLLKTNLNKNSKYHTFPKLNKLGIFNILSYEIYVITIPDFLRIILLSEPSWKNLDIDKISIIHSIKR